MKCNVIRAACSWWWDSSCCDWQTAMCTQYTRTDTRAQWVHEATFIAIVGRIRLFSRVNCNTLLAVYWPNNETIEFQVIQCGKLVDQCVPLLYSEPITLYRPHTSRPHATLQNREVECLTIQPSEIPRGTHAGTTYVAVAQNNLGFVAAIFENMSALAMISFWNTTLPVYDNHILKSIRDLEQLLLTLTLIFAANVNVICFIEIKWWDGKN